MSWEDILKRQVSMNLKIDPDNPLYVKYGWDKDDISEPHGNPDRKDWEDTSIKIFNALSNEQPYWIHIDELLWFSDEHNISQYFGAMAHYKKHLDEMVEAGILEIKMVRFGKDENAKFYQPLGSNLYEAPQEESWLTGDINDKVKTYSYNVGD